MSVIVKTDLEFVREKLKSPFGFKGRYLDELWQTVALVATERHTAVAPATESVLWSDGAVFGENPPAAANALMMTVTARALRLLEGRELVRPDLMLDALLPSLEDYAEAVCGRCVAPTLRAQCARRRGYRALVALRARERHRQLRRHRPALCKGSDGAPPRAAFAYPADLLRRR